MNGWNRITDSGRIIGRCSVAFALAAACLLPSPAQSQETPAEAQWIWTPAHKKDAAPERTDCHFRKTFTLKDPEAATLAIAADDQYELFINGKRVGVGESTKKLDE